MAAILTGDADIAQDYAISREAEDSLPPILDLLHGVDPSFPPCPIDRGAWSRLPSKMPTATGSSS